jgi:hypothetical protein
MGCAAAPAAVASLPACIQTRGRVGCSPPLSTLARGDVQPRGHYWRGPLPPRVAPRARWTPPVRLRQFALRAAPMAEAPVIRVPVRAQRRVPVRRPVTGGLTPVWRLRLALPESGSALTLDSMRGRWREAGLPLLRGRGAGVRVPGRAPKRQSSVQGQAPGLPMWSQQPMMASPTSRAAKLNPPQEPAQSAGLECRPRPARTEAAGATLNQPASKTIPPA